MASALFNLISRNKKFVNVEIKINEGHQHEKLSNVIEMFFCNVILKLIILHKEEHQHYDGSTTGNKCARNKIRPEDSAVPSGS